jgi:hypothetical protein
MDLSPLQVVKTCKFKTRDTKVAKGVPIASASTTRSPVPRLHRTDYAFSYSRREKTFAANSRAALRNVSIASKKRQQCGQAATVFARYGNESGMACRLNPQLELAT